MELNNATVQDIQLELIRRSKWNSFNILAGDEESARKLVDLCWQWNADEAQYHNAKITSDRLHRGLLKNHCLVEAWWD
jgi:hypothetical protein